MALLARLGHTAGYVIRVGSLLEVGDVAGGALRWSAHIACSGVALHALNVQMSAGEGERGLVVIEISAAPGSGVVAVHASLWNAGSRVVRAGGLLEVREVTSHALRRGGGVVGRGVALGTGKGYVRSRQGKLRHGIVIEFHAKPGRSSVTGRAILREAGGAMVRVRCPVEVLDMTT